MIARVAATDTPTTQIAATKTSRPAGRCLPGGPGPAVPTATGSMPGAAPGPAAAGGSPDPGSPSPGAGTAGSSEPAAPLGAGLALAVVRASGDRPGSGDFPGVPAGADPGSEVTFTVTEPTLPPPPSRHPGSMVTLTRPPRNSTATWLSAGTTPRSAPLIIRCADWSRLFTNVTVPPEFTVTPLLSGRDDAPTPSSPQSPWKVTVGWAADATPGTSSAPPMHAAASTGANR